MSRTITIYICRWLPVTASLILALAPAAQAQIVFSKAFSPDTIPVGGVSTLTFDISTDTGLANLDFTDTLPPGVEIAATPNASTDCASATLTANAGESTITFADGTMPGESMCSASVDVTGTTVGAKVNISSQLTSDDPSSPHGTATDTLTVELPPSSVGFSKVFDPATIGPGSATQLIFEIDNGESPTPVSDLAFTDVLPAGITLADPASAFTDCVGAVLSAPDGGTTISLTGGNVGADQVCNVTVNVVGTATATNTSGDLTSSDGNSGAGLLQDLLPRHHPPRRHQHAHLHH